MKNMTLIEWLIAGAAVAILVALFFSTSASRKNFKAVCDEARGTTVWDGRQYQCIKATK